MAFGFGFNKQKVLSAAEKYVQQGKMQNAIAEYEKVLKADPKDLTVTNTVGDLYSRLGEADKATECFKVVGDAYASQGFTVKAIAMYKKISKLKPSLESVLKLAELYTQQGLFNDARAQYLQVAEEFLKSGELENAVRIFQKILEMDTENTNMRIRLAEVYVRLGKKNDAWQIFSAVAETLRSKGSLSAAEEVLQRLLTLDPGNSYALLMQGRNLLEGGDVEAAIVALQKVPDIDSNPDGLRDLLKAYLKTGRLSDAGTLASKLLSVHNDLASISIFADALMQAGQYENALQVYGQHADRLLAEDSEKVLKHLHSVIGHVRDNPASLERLLALFQKAGETTHITEVIELLAHASVQSGDLVRARDLYQRLATMEPGNSLHMANYRQMVSQIGGSAASALITAEEAAVIVDELEATAPSIHQHYSDAVALAVRSALTDAELFISYNMPAKALGPLTAALPQAPTDLRLNQRLAALHTRASRFAEASICCRTLQDVYSEAGYPDEATRYGELADRYEERATTPDAAFVAVAPAVVVSAPGVAVAAAAGEAPAEIPASPWPSAPPQAAEDTEFAIVSDQADSTVQAEAEAPAPAVAEADATEIDLSSEWDDGSITIELDAPPEAATETEIASVKEPVTSAPISQAKATSKKATQGKADPEKISETTDEIRFYLEHGMPEQAAAAFEKLQLLTSDETTLQTIRAEIAAASQRPSAGDEASTIEAVSEFVTDAASAELTVDEAPAIAEPVPEQAPVAETRASSKKHAEPVVAKSAGVEPSKVEPAVAAAPGVLQDFVSDLESSLGDSFAPGAVAQVSKPDPVATKAPTPKTPSVAAPQPAAAQPAATQPIGEFVADLEASLGDDFLTDAVSETKTAATKTAPPAQVIAPAAQVSVPVIAPVDARVSAPLASAAAAASGSGAVAPHAPTPPIPAQAPAVVPSTPTLTGTSAGIDLAEMFGELKQDLESNVANADEDPETHYSLGIAFREMGLLDEAIGELQKTCQAIDHGHPFPQTMQTYTWLAQCFLDKGVTAAAIRWYEKALKVAGIDEETRTALHYEIGAAYETAGDKPSALRHFMEVYGRNIDYRDVAERIKPLKS